MQIAPKDAGLAIWWIIWFGILSSIAVLHFVLPGTVGSPVLAGGMSYLLLIPLFAGIIVRWFVLPRLRAREHALMAFVVGLALSESCAMLAIFLAPEMRPTYVLLAILGVLQFAPLFARKYYP